MTPKQTLAAHLAVDHKNVKVTARDTLATLQRKHGYDHHHYGSWSHYHEGRNLGPADRPAGWKTGEGAVRKPPPSQLGRKDK